MVESVALLTWVSNRFLPHIPPQRAPAGVLGAPKTTFVLSLAHVCSATLWTINTTKDRQLAYKGQYFTKNVLFCSFSEYLSAK